MRRSDLVWPALCILLCTGTDIQTSKVFQLCCLGPGNGGPGGRGCCREYGAQTEIIQVGVSTFANSVIK